MLARFIPIVRTFAPFVAAGIGQMGYSRFAMFKRGGRHRVGRVFVGGVGYLFGNIPTVRATFIVIVAIIVISILPR